MKLNRSLAISSKIQECKRGNIIGLLDKEFPTAVLQESPSKKSRNRIFTFNNTLLTMVLTATQADKTLKNSVDLYYLIDQHHRPEVRQALEESREKEKQLDAKKEKKAGRPKKYAVQLPGSLQKDISLNTAAYSKARGRVPIEMTEKLFKATRIEQAENIYSHWHGYRVLMGEGTYLPMQDTQALRKEYQVKDKGESQAGYPQALLETIVERGTGQIHSFRFSNRHVSELALFYQILDELPSQSLLLLDSLYNCYQIIAKCHRAGIQWVMPAQRRRCYQVEEVLGQGDEMIGIKTPKNRSKWLKENEAANRFLLRGIECQSPNGKGYVLETSLLDQTIDKRAIQALYQTRWDIEIGIREIKTIMGINILRSQTPEMALKELTVSLSSYNLLRKFI